MKWVLGVLCALSGVAGASPADEMSRAALRQLMTEVPAGAAASRLREKFAAALFHLDLINDEARAAAGEDHARTFALAAYTFAGAVEADGPDAASRARQAERIARKMLKLLDLEFERAAFTARTRGLVRAAVVTGVRVAGVGHWLAFFAGLARGRLIVDQDPALARRIRRELIRTLRRACERDLAS